MERPVPSALDELRALAKQQRSQIEKLTAEVNALKARLPASEEAQYEDLSFPNNIYQPLVITEVARWAHHNFLPPRLLTDAERRARVPAPKLPRLGESMAENVKRSESDPKFLEAKRLYKGTPGKMDKDVHAALRLFQELAAQNNIPAKLYTVKIKLALHGMTDWRVVLESLRMLAELAIRGYPPALYYLGWKVFLNASGLFTHGSLVAGNDIQGLCLSSAIAFGHWRSALVQLNRHRGDQRCRNLIQRAADGADGSPPSVAAKFFNEFYTENEAEDRFNVVRSMLKLYPTAIWHIDNLPRQVELLTAAAELGNAEACIRLAVGHFPTLANFVPRRSSKVVGGRMLGPLTVNHDPHKAVALLLQALEHNADDAAVVLWAMCRHPPVELMVHPEINTANKAKYMNIAARFGCISALRKQRGKQMQAGFLMDLLKPETMRTLRVFPHVHLPADVLKLIFCHRKYTLNEILPWRLVSKAWLVWVANAPWNLRLRCGAAQMPFVRRFIGMRSLEADVMSRRITPLCKNLKSLRIYGRTPLTFKEVCLNTSLTSLSFHCGNNESANARELLPPPFHDDTASPSEGDLASLQRLTSLVVLASVSTRASDGTIRVVLQQVGHLTNLHTLVVVNAPASSDLSQLKSLTQLSRLALQQTSPPSQHNPRETRELPAQVLIDALTPLHNLTCLDLTKQYDLAGPRLAALLREFPRLSVLACSSAPVAPVVDALADHVPHLNALSFACNCGGIETSRLSELVNLTALRLSTAEECGLVHLRQLTYLELSNDAFYRANTARVLRNLPNLRHFGAVHDANRIQQHFPPANSIDPTVVCRDAPTHLTSLRLSVATSGSKGSFLSSQFIDAHCLPALLNRVPGLTRLELKAQAALALQELMMLTSLRSLRFLSFEGGVSDALLDTLAAACPHLEPSKVHLSKLAQPEAYAVWLAKRGYQIEGGNVWHLGFTDVFVTGSTDDL